jgi:hypothetical protein
VLPQLHTVAPIDRAIKAVAFGRDGDSGSDSGSDSGGGGDRGGGGGGGGGGGVSVAILAKKGVSDDRYCVC